MVIARANEQERRTNEYCWQSRRHGIVYTSTNKSSGDPMKYLIKRAFFVLSTFTVAVFAQSTAYAGGPYKMSASGELTKPEGYREWVYVGTPVTPNDMNNGKAAFPEFHNVYIDPKSYAHWKKTGDFRDGTIIIKELVSVGSKAAVSGNGYFMGDFIGLEATVKSKKHFSKEPGNWAYFSFTNHDNPKNLKASANAFPTEACAACHKASAKDDMVFTQYYPVLTSSKGK